MSKKLKELKKWAEENVSTTDLLPDNTSKEVTTRLIDVLEEHVDEKYFLSEEKVKKLTINNDLSGKLNMYDFTERDKVHSVNKVSPTLNTMQGGDRQSKIAIKQIGNIVDNKETFGGNPQRGRIYNFWGLSPSLNCMRGGGLEPKIAIPCLTPERINKRQNGRRFKNNNEEMFTLTSQDRHGIAIKENVKKGYTLAHLGDSVNFSYLTSKTRRGRVGRQIAQTLQAKNVEQGVVLGVKPHPISTKYQFGSYALICPTLIVTGYKMLKMILINNHQGKIINPLKNKTPYGWHFEQGVYHPFGITRTIKANGGSGNIPKAIIGSTQKNAYVGDGTQSPSLTSAMGQGGGHVPMIVYMNMWSHLMHYVGKTEYGRMGRQAAQTMNQYKNIIQDGMTINAFNQTLNSSSLSPTLTTRPDGFKTAILPITNQLRIRKLTPLECWRLQGFDDAQFYKAKNAGVSNSQLYKQAGNSVTVNVVDAIIETLDYHRKS